MEFNDNDVKVFGKIVSIASEGKIADTQQIYDSTFENGDFQSNINKKLLDKIQEISQTVTKIQENIEKIQEEGIKTTKNYFYTSINKDETASSSERNKRSVPRASMQAIVNHIDSLERKYPSQYIFTGDYIVNEHATTSDENYIHYDKMYIYHFDNIYKMYLSTQEITFDRLSETGKAKVNLKGISFECDSSNIQEETTTWVKEVYLDAISVNERVQSEDGDMMYKNIYRVLTDDGTYKKIEDILGVDIINNGEGNKFLSDNGQYIEINSGEIEPQIFTLTVQADPSDSIIKLNDIEQNTISVEKGSKVKIEVSKEGYITYYQSITVNENKDLQIKLTEESEIVIDKEELNMNVYKVWLKSSSGDLDESANATIKEYLDEINTGNMALLYITPAFPQSEPGIKDYSLVNLQFSSTSGFTGFGFYKDIETSDNVGYFKQFSIKITTNSETQKYKISYYGEISMNATILNGYSTVNIPKQYICGINKNEDSYTFSGFNKSELIEYMDSAKNQEDINMYGQSYITVSRIYNDDSWEVPYDIYPDIIDKSKIGSTGTVLHGVSKNADTNGHRLELEISGSTDGGDGYTITKCQYVDQNGQPLS